MPQDMTNSTLRRTIGAHARRARLQLELTQEDVAERVELATEVYGRLERGGMAPSVYTLRKLCIALNLPADLALGITETQAEGEAVALTPEPTEPIDIEPRHPGSSYLRRILRHGRKLTPQSLRLLAQLTAALPQKPPEKPTPPPEE